MLLLCYTALSKDRLAAAIHHDLQETQYGSMQNISTSIPRNCIKRIAEGAYTLQDPAILVFFGLGKHV